MHHLEENCDVARGKGDPDGGRENECHLTSLVRMTEYTVHFSGPHASGNLLNQSQVFKLYRSGSPMRDLGQI